jgi:hypothetical protein
MLILDTSKPVNRDGNTYCGPLVVAAIMGTNTGAVATAITGMRAARDPVTILRGRKAPRRGPIRGTYYSELCALLERSGFGVRSVDVGVRFQPDRKWGYVNATCTRGARQLPMFANPSEWHAVTWLRAVYRPLWAFLSHADNGTYIVNTPGHWAIASGGQWCETYTRGEWVAKRAAPKQNRRVINAWQIERVSQ